MKSERRHELERNQLLVWLMQHFEKVRPYANAVLTAVLVLLLVLVAWLWWERLQTGKSGTAWDAYFAALTTMDRTALENVAQNHPGSEAAHWALVTLGDLQLDSGANLLFVNKTSANLELRKAVEHYQSVLAQASNPVLLERATYGLARARESQGDLAQAQKAYQEMVDKWPGGAYSPMAKQRLKDLAQHDTKAFYDKFAKFDPKPALPDEQGVPGKKPAFDLDSIPDAPGATKPAGAAKAATEPAKAAEAPAMKLELARPATSPAKSEPKPEVKPDPKPAVKPEAKPEPKRAS